MFKGTTLFPYIKLNVTVVILWSVYIASSVRAYEMREGEPPIRIDRFMTSPRSPLLSFSCHAINTRLIRNSYIPRGNNLYNISPKVTKIKGKNYSQPVIQGISRWLEAG